jgi:BirA family biotin operon repressor/biotin-[acetyl-CoA-carboxylase] ligase
VPDLRLKYPNDLMVNGCKLGGILVESTAVEGELGWLIIGIGINVAAAPDLPEQRTIALAERGVVITPEKLAWELLFRIGAWRAIIENQGFAPVRAAWRLLAVDPDRAETHLRQWERD